MQTNKRNVTIALLVATFLTAIEGTIVSTAMPTIVSDLQGVELMNWVFSVYLLTSAVVTPIFGKLADLYGRKRIFTIGAIIFLIGSILSGMSQTMNQLIWYRAFQGIGAGAIMPVTFTIVGDLYPYEQRAKIQGLISSVWGIAGIVGPLVGGFFVVQLSWHWIFFINVPFGLIAIAMVWFWLHESYDKKKKSIDYLGAIVFSLGMIALLFALQRGGETQQWGSADVVLLLIGAAFCLGLFLWIESKAAEPMIPLRLFGIRTIAMANAGGFLLSAVLIGVTAYMPVWVQGVLGQSATSAGMTLAPMSISWTIGAFIGGKLLVQKGAKLTSAIGMIVLLLSVGWLASATLMTPQYVLAMMMFLLGFGFGITFTIYTVIVQSAVDWSMRGAATATNTLFRTLGQAIGVAVLGSYLNQSNIQRLSGTDVDVEEMNKLINPEMAHQLSASDQGVLRETLVAGLSGVFLLLVLFAVVGLIAVAMLPRAKEEAALRPAEN